MTGYHKRLISFSVRIKYQLNTTSLSPLDCVTLHNRLEIGIEFFFSFSNLRFDRFPQNFVVDSIFLPRKLFIPSFGPARPLPYVSFINLTTKHLKYKLCSWRGEVETKCIKTTTMKRKCQRIRYFIWCIVSSFTVLGRSTRYTYIVCSIKYYSIWVTRPVWLILCGN